MDEDALLTNWHNAFALVERGEWPKIRTCAGLWYVSGILYERFAKPILSDAAYDSLSRHLLDHLEAAHAAGADLLTRDELQAGTAQNWENYPKPYGHVAAVLVAGRQPPGPEGDIHSPLLN